MDFFKKMFKKNPRTNSTGSSSSTSADSSNNEKTKLNKNVNERHVQVKEPVKNWNINEKTNANMNYNNALKNSRRSIHVNQYNMNNRNYFNATRIAKAKNHRTKTMKMMKNRGKLFLNENNLRNRNRSRF
jgi:hypothetical protein